MRAYPRLGAGQLAGCATAVIVAAAVGCGGAPKGPQVTAEALPRALHSLEQTCDAILTACEAGEASTAHRDLHAMGKRVSSVRTVVGAIELPGSVGEDLLAKIAKIDDGMSSIDEKLHGSEDAEIDESTIASLRETVGTLRGGLTADILAELKKLDDAEAARDAKRDATRTKAAETAETDAADDAMEQDTPPVGDDPNDPALSTDPGDATAPSAATEPAISTNPDLGAEVNELADPQP